MRLFVYGSATRNCSTELRSVGGQEIQLLFGNPSLVAITCGNINHKISEHCSQYCNYDTSDFSLNQNFCLHNKERRQRVQTQQPVLHCKYTVFHYIFMRMLSLSRFPQMSEMNKIGGNFFENNW